MIIKGDLSSLYEVEMRDYYAAGVRDPWPHLCEEFGRHHKELGIPDMKSYVNAGVMLFNLDKIRADGISDSLIAELSHDYRLMDQDILNKALYGKIKILPLRYNFFSTLFNLADRAGSPVYSQDEIEEAQKQIAILHYSTKWKPWTCRRLETNKLWWEEAKSALTKEEYNETLRLASEAERESDWSAIIAKLGKKVVIFGYSEIGRVVSDRILRQKPEIRLFFCDNDPSKWGNKYNDIVVYTLEQLTKRNERKQWLVTIQNDFNTIRDQLLAFGVPETDILKYIHKNESYYEQLAPEFLNYELSMLE